MFAGGGIQRYFPQRNNDNGCKDHVAVLESSYREAADVSAKILLQAKIKIDTYLS